MSLHSPSSMSDSRRGRAWVPLFIATSSADPNSPLITSTVLPPTPRRPPGSASSFGSYRSDDDVYDFAPSPIRAESDAYTQVLLPLPPRSDTHESRSADYGSHTPSLPQHNQGPGVYRQSEEARASARATKGHVRQRSSYSGDAEVHMGELGGLGVVIPMSTSQLPDDYVPYVRSPSIFLGRRRSSYQLLLHQEKRRVSRIILRGAALLLVLLLGAILLRPRPTESPMAKLNGEDDVDDLMEGTIAQLKPWLHRNLPQSWHGALGNLETVPFPAATHPRTTTVTDRTSLSDYLSTRLGSHFSMPTSLHPSHLWLTVATGASVRITTPHLQAFVSKLDADAERKNALSSDTLSAPTVQLPRRQLVTVCLDDDCLRYCDSKPEWYCFGGYRLRNLREDRVRKAMDIVKLKATLATLASGRRVFFVDENVYFRDDPLAFMGDLDKHDLQILDSWTSVRTNAGFIFLNPTQNVVALWKRLLELARVDDGVKSPKSKTTNLLLGQATSSHSLVVTPKEKVKPGENDDSALPREYGQSEFVSPWAGGTDVKVLDRKRFRSSNGKLDERPYVRERDSQAVFFRAPCGDDLATADYVAGALGYHQPSVAYPSRTASDVPHFPMMLTMSALNGTAEEVTFSIASLLQLAHDSSRALVPPPTGRIVQPIAAHHAHQDRYIWNLFPTSKWATSSSNARVLSPSYIEHALQYLRDSTTIARAKVRYATRDLTEVSTIDAAEYTSYRDFLDSLRRPTYAISRVVRVVNLDQVVGREGWELRKEFAAVEMCSEPQRGAQCQEQCVVSQN